METGRLDVVVGGQYGSESKGRVTGELAVIRSRQGKAVIGVRVAGPNAGHVVIDRNGQRFALRQIPVAMVKVPIAYGVIAAGSEIDPEVLDTEIEDLERRGGHQIRHRLLIDQQATILEPKHRDQEGGNDGPMQNRIGSTGKGIGAARADRVMRTATTAANWDGIQRYGHLIDTQDYLNDALESNAGYAVIIEGTQGYALGLHAGHYPYCTSSDCRAIDFLAMAGISPWGQISTHFKVHVVLRAYPIRVAGSSGPMQDETSWGELGLPEEHTTVTHKIRRVGGWDPDLARAAVRANGGGMGSDQVVIALAMADQRFNGIHGWIDRTRLLAQDDVRDWIVGIERECEARIASVGTGPDSTVWL